MNKIKVKLKDVVTVVNGSTPSTANPEFYDGEIIWITPKDISTQNNKYIRYGERSITKEGLSSCSASIVPKGSVLMSSRAPIGLLSIAEIDLCTNQGFKNFIPDKDKIESEYLYYYLKTKIDDINKLGSGTTFKEVSKTSIENFEILIPNNISDQSRISKVLSSLDSKIALNNRINAELEAMAKTVYDYWFVQFDFPFDFAQGKPSADGKPYKSSGGKMVWREELKREVPEGWKIKNLESLGNFKNGVNYDPSNPGDVACPIINVRNISASSYFLKNEDLDVIHLKASDVKKYSVHEGSIIIARSGIPGATRLISDIASNTLYCGFAIHYELIDLSLKIPIFFFLKSIEQQIQNGSGGTIMKNVNQGTLNALQIALPTNNETITEFNKIIDPIFGKINLIQQENQQLSSLRDWLLPMLMNGQVKVGSGYEGDVESLMAAEAGLKY